MASRTQVILEDDIDGGNAEETLRFAIDGKSYAIDLSSKNADKLRRALAPYLAAARREGSLPRPSGRPKTTADYIPAQVRAWAQDAGYEVSSRGRVSSDLVAAFKSAGN